MPCKLTLAISTSGSGQMQPLPMNELLKSQMEAAGFQIDFKVMDWNSLIEIARSGVQEISRRSMATTAPARCSIRYRRSSSRCGRSTGRPAGSNWGHFFDQEIEDLGQRQILNEFDGGETAWRNADQSCTSWRVTGHVMIWVVHDLNPRALSPKLSGFVQAQQLVPGSDPDRGETVIRYIGRRRAVCDPHCFWRQRRVLFPGLSRTGRSAADDPARRMPRPIRLRMVKAAYGFDQPIPIQFLKWLGRVLMGDFGQSIATRRPVLLEVSRARMSEHRRRW